METKRMVMKAVVGAAMVAMGLMGAGSAKAQDAVQVKFHLDEQVRWGSAVLAPGNYTFRLESLGNTSHAFVTAENGKKTVIVVASSVSDANMKEGSALLLDRKAGEMVVRSLNVPKSKVSLNFAEAGGDEAVEKEAVAGSGK